MAHAMESPFDKETPTKANNKMLSLNLQQDLQQQLDLVIKIANRDLT